jgi:MFS superfamily sulfate permease-like transporter
VWAALSLAVVLMGVLLAAAGWLRLAEAIKFMPSPVSAGFVTGIGLLVIWSQLGPLLGLEGRLSKYHWPDLLAQLKPASLLVGAATALAIWVYPKVAKRGQPALVAVVVGTLLYYLIAWLYGAEHLGPTLGTIAPVATAESNFLAVWGNIGPTWLLSTGLYVLPYAAFLALQAIMNAAVTSAAVGGITGVRSDVNRTLKAQGIANILCGTLAALPVSTVASVSLPAARMKGVTPIVTAASCAILFTAVLLAGGLLAYIPVAVLAGILVMGGAGMIDRWARGLAGRVWRGSGKDRHLTWNLAIVVAVAAALFFGGVPLALLVGAVLAMVLLVLNLSATTTFGAEDATKLASTRVWSAEQAQWLAGVRRSVAVFRPRGGLFFGTADQLSTHLAALEPGIKYCVLDLSKLTTIDATGCQILATGTKKLFATGVTTVLAGLQVENTREQELIALGLTHPDPKTHWFEDLDHALEWVETQLLRERWPNVAADTPVAISDTPLATGLSAPELEELQSCLKRVDLEAGPLFRQGDPGSSMYVIDEGFVEIRIGRAGTGKSTRLAAFGPGSMFGEIAMLTSDERTADAICVKPTRLYELRREAFAELERQSPRLYARIMTNLNVHLANRLIVATGIVRAQQ